MKEFRPVVYVQKTPMGEIVKSAIKVPGWDLLEVRNTYDDTVKYPIRNVPYVTEALERIVKAHKDTV